MYGEAHCEPIQLEVCPQLDPYQFAYKRQRGTDDVINSLVHLVIKHLENPRAYAKLLFVDFSSAFNTLQPHILLKTMQRMNVNPFIIKWFYSFLTNRSQQVRVNRTLSESTIINTGAPQGCVSSPVLFTLYTNECTCTVNNYMIKFSDDTAILGLISGTSDVTTYKHEVQNFVQWCDKHFLSINTKKQWSWCLTPNPLVTTYQWSLMVRIQCPPLILAPLVNMTKGGCENKSALFILFIFHSKNSQNSNLSLK